MKKAAIAIFVTSALGLSACQQAEKEPAKDEVVTFDTEKQKQAYAIGAMVGQFVEKQLAAQENLDVVLDKSIVLKGFAAALQQKSQFDMQELQTITRTIEAEMGEKKQLLTAEVFADNAKRESVIVTDSGLQYEVLTKGKGAKPSIDDTVKVHYRGTLLDGTEFDSTYSRNEPAVFPLSRVISGWTEGVQLMNVGSKFKFLIPSNLAYGPRGKDPIPGNSALIFEVELLEIIAAPQTDK